MPTVNNNEVLSESIPIAVPDSPYLQKENRTVFQPGKPKVNEQKVTHSHTNTIIERSKHCASLETIQRTVGGILSPNEIKTAKALQAEHEKFQTLLEGVSRDRVVKGHKAQSAKFIIKGSRKEIEQFEISKGEKIKVAREQSRVLKEAHRTWLEREVPTVIGPMVRKLAEAVKGRADEIERAEKTAAESVGCPFEPSETLKATRSLFNLLDAAAQQIESKKINRCSPRSLLWHAI